MAGFDPNEDNLILSEGADFFGTYVETGVVWPEDTVATLSFPGRDLGPYVAINVTHPKGAGAFFVVPRQDTTAEKLPAKAPYHIHLEKQMIRSLWFRGIVERQD